MTGVEPLFASKTLFFESAVGSAILLALCCTCSGLLHASLKYIVSSQSVIGVHIVDLMLTGGRVLQAPI